MNDIIEMSYIARKGCGCIVATMVDIPESRRAVACEVGKWIRKGFMVERVTVDYVRENMKHCPHKAADKLRMAAGESNDSQS